MSTIYSKIKETDKFGHEIVLNFNNKGNFHNTFFGGLLSILVNIFVLIYIQSLIRKVVFYEDDSIITVTKYGDPLDLGDVPLNSTGFVPGFLFIDFHTDAAIPLSKI